MKGRLLSVIHRARFVCIRSSNKTLTCVQKGSYALMLKGDDGKLHNFIICKTPRVRVYTPYDCCNMAGLRAWDA